MARARNIKPGFFKNELLVEQSPFVRLLFIGLWTLADREGRVEDRPKRIKLELFPYDSEDVGEALTALADNGFISRYTAGGKSVIQILSFSKHQTPHGTEKDSELPDSNGDLTVNARDKNGYVTGGKRRNNVNPEENNVNPPLENVNPPANNALNPDSLNPDSLKHEPKPTPPSARSVSNGFAEFWQAYPKKTGKGAAEKSWAKIRPDDQILSAMLAALSWQTKSADWTKDGGTFIPHPATWLNAKRWEDQPLGPSAVVVSIGQPAQSTYREYRPS